MAHPPGQGTIRPATYAARRRSIGRRLDPQRRLGTEAINAWIDEKIRRDIATLTRDAENRRARGDQRGAARVYDQIGDLQDLLTPPHTRKAG